MRCRVCTRCGRCGLYPATRIAETGQAEGLPRFVPRRGVGAAIDVGSTTIVVRTYDLATGALLAQKSEFNPQRALAADVMGRISAAIDGRLGELQALVRGALVRCLDGAKPDEAVLVGNTTMLHLFVGESPAAYATAPFRATRFFGETVDWDGVPTRLPRCSHAFFGADADVAVMASGMTARPGPELFADIGTNGEIALWKDGELTIASVAAGPAFERPGVTGSAIVAAIANGLDDGAIDETGCVEAELADGVTQADVRAVQLAKAAVAAGLQSLLDRTGTALGDVTRFSLAGGFGSGLDPERAARIGLFDRRLLDRVAVCGNLAIEGASGILLNPDWGARCDETAARAHHVELGGDPAFSEAFMEAISF